MWSVSAWTWWRELVPFLFRPLFRQVTVNRITQHSGDFTIPSFYLASNVLVSDSEFLITGFQPSKLSPCLPHYLFQNEADVASFQRNLPHHFSPSRTSVCLSKFRALSEFNATRCEVHPPQQKGALSTASETRNKLPYLHMSSISCICPKNTL